MSIGWFQPSTSGHRASQTQHPRHTWSTPLFINPVALCHGCRLTPLTIGPQRWGFSNTAVDIFFFNFRMARDSPLLERLIKAGYHVEPCCVAPDVTAIVEFPVAAGNSIRTTRDITMWEQLSLAAFMQRYWADNQVCADWVGCSMSAGNFCANNLMIAQQICVGLAISCLFVVWFEFFWPEWTAVCGQKEWLLKSSK